MNWFSIVNFILALAPQELALVKAIVDAAHLGHSTGSPLQPVPLVQVGMPSETAAPSPVTDNTVSTSGLGAVSTSGLGAVSTSGLGTVSTSGLGAVSRSQSTKNVLTK